MIRYLNNERGSSVIPFTALFAMAMVILMVLLMMWISAEITFMNIRNSVKNELTNVSIRISEDTYNAMREGNLHAYYQKLSTDSSYRNELQQMICDNIRTAMPLETASYKIDDMTLTFLETMTASNTFCPAAWNTTFHSLAMQGQYEQRKSF